ncbi:phage tail protein [Lysobacter auxotrophicus]|uniref:Tip attachment protein J domain-containing protein n=1 Tax=Lysobacter auxotrophicus TaxID=2992573 RepID=A0ABM8DFX4_9GAMM|nr:phage tail protein [Lysobacter auxotrophicus]BDU17514.1 hypothetical protein LA521A_27150 [Lysobacter auxotrophicus]
MIPEGRLSTQAVAAPFVWPGKRPGYPLEARHPGGVNISDASQGLEVKIWTATYDQVAESVSLTAPGSPVTLLFTAAGIKEIDLAFDQNMRPLIAYVQGSQAKFFWYDPTVEGYTHTSLPAGTITPRCAMDDTRSQFQSQADIIIAYVRAGSMYFRLQRERYATEHLLQSGVAGGLVRIGMNSQLRFQFELEDAGTEDWRLPQVIEDVCRRANLPEHLINLVMMDWEKVIRGYTIGSAYAGAGILQTLSSIFFFDPSNANGKVAFVPRGRDAVATIIDDDLIDDGEDAEVEDTRRQDSIGIPRVLHLNYYDVDGGLNTDKQRSERPEGARADGEQSLQTPVVLSADEAASVVAITHGMMVEQQKGELTFALPDSWLRLTEADPVFLQLKNKMVRAILTRVETDDGEQRYKGIRDRQSLYRTQVQGIPAAPVTRPPSSVAGPTTVEILDIPILRDTHDQLGFYVAVSGIFPAWPGALVELSLDGGATFVDEQSTRNASVVGKLTTALGAHPREYPDATNTCRVQIDTPNALLENTDLAGMLNRTNRAVIGNEMVNFADADEFAPGVWDLSHWLRGRKDTAPVAHSVGERFVLLDTAMFIPADMSWLNRTLTFRAMTFGRPVEEATIVSVVFTGQSQVERHPAYLQARRDGLDAVVSWQGVGRLGGGARVAMGAYFAGYRLTLTDGTTTREVDTAATSYTGSLVAFDGPVTARVQQRNQLTGLGPYIEVTI